MVATMTGSQTQAARAAPLFSIRVSRAFWLIGGTLLSLLTVGGRWDAPLAAWFAPVLLLRFCRSSRRVTGIALVFVSSTALALSWAWALDVPMPAMTIIGCVILGLVSTFSYAADRLLGPRLGVTARLMLFPAALVASEFAIDAFSPFGAIGPSLLAITQHGDLPLLQIVALTGPYGIAFLIGWFATVANLVWDGPLTWSRLRWPVMSLIVALGVIYVGGALRLGFFAPGAGYVRAAGISPSKAVLERANGLLGMKLLGPSSPVSKTDFDRLDPSAQGLVYAAPIDELFANTRLAAQAGARIVVWSENAAVIRPADEPALLARAAGVARENHIFLSIADNAPFLFDRVHLFGPDGRRLWSYDKGHPIPGMETYAPGKTPPPVASTPWGRLATVICYDADFPGPTRVNTDILLVPGGDWPAMGRVHTLTMASLRAIENGYTLFRVDFNGLSAAFDPLGRVVATEDTVPDGQHVMIANIPTRASPTVYRAIGDVFAWLCVLGVAGFVILAVSVRRPKAL